MYLDHRLWPFTAGFRLRMAVTVLLGLMSTIFGVGRLALLGWLLGEIFGGAAYADLAWPFAAVAVTMLLRGLLEYVRTMHAHRTSALVQLRLREQLYHHVVALGPGHFALQRTGDVMLSIVDGVEQLETYFGQYLPQLVVALLTPLGIFAFVAILDLPMAAIMLAFALLTLVAPAAFHHWDSRNSIARRAAYGSFGAEFLDAVQGLAMLKAFGQSAPGPRSDRRP
jgi:ATP-binding cassette subfamily C protein CydCD